MPKLTKLAVSLTRMEFDEYEYLEKTVEEGDVSNKKKEESGNEKSDRSYRKIEGKRYDEEGGDEERGSSCSKKSRGDGEENGVGKRDREKERHRSSRDKERDRDKVREGSRDKESDRSYRKREGERYYEEGGDEERGSSRSYRKIDEAIMEAAPENRIFAETIAFLVSQKGLKLERTLMSIDTNYNEKNFRFLCKSDPGHAFYQQKLNEYLKDKKNQDTHDCCVPDDDYEEEIDFPSPPRYRCDLSFGCPNKITIKDLGIIKLTAQFVARYDMYFLRGLRKRVANKPQFEFLEQTNIRFSFYNGLVRAYSSVLRPCSETLKRNDVAFVGVFDVFFYRLQLEKLEEGDVMAMIDLHSFVSGVDCFAHMDVEDFHYAMTEPAHLSAMMLGFTEMQPLGSKQLTTTQARDAPQPVELRPRSRAYTFFEKSITLKELGIIKLTALFVARYGPCFRRDLMERVVMNPLFEFLKPTDKCSNRSRFFLLVEYAYSRVLLPSEKLWKSDGCTAAVLQLFSKCLQLEKLEDEVEMATVDLHALVGGVDCFAHMYGGNYSYIAPPPDRLSTFMGSQLRNPQNHQDDDDDDDDDDDAQQHFPEVITPDGARLSLPCRKRTFRFPAKGITLKELGIIMLTAQFVVRYDMYFVRGLRKRVVMNRQFGFLKLADRRYKFYRGLVDAYCRVLRTSKELEKSDACTETVLERFFDILKLGEEGEGVGLHAFVGVVDCFAHMDDEEYSVVMPPPVHLLMNMIPPELWRPGTLVLPPPKRSPAAAVHDYCVGTDLDSEPEPENEPHPFRDALVGFTLKSMCIIKVTAQFEARYGMDFIRALMTRVAEKTPQQLEFMEPTSGSRFNFYRGLVGLYSRVLIPCKKLDADTVLEGFFHWVDRFQQKGVDLATFVLHGFVGAVDCFAPRQHNKSTLVQPGRASDQRPPPSMKRPALPLAVPLSPKKRQKIDDESALAQHSGSSTIIRIFVPGIGEVVI